MLSFVGCCRSFLTHPTINDELPFRIMVGAVQVRPDVHEFTESAVSFTDGTSEPIDAVVFATGYEYKIPFLDDSISKIEDNRTCLYKYMLPPHLLHPTLGIVGMVQATGSILPISEIQCRWFTRLVTGMDLLSISYLIFQSFADAIHKAMSPFVLMSRKLVFCRTVLFTLLLRNDQRYRRET